MEIRMRWEELIKIPKLYPISRLEMSLIEIDEDFYQILDTIYCITTEFIENLDQYLQGERFIVSFLWTSNFSGARRIFSQEIEGDDGAIATPPMELLPFAGYETYGQILKGLKKRGFERPTETASYRIMKDGAFICRQIETKVATYCFRSRKHDDSEMPFAIFWKMRGWTE